jgi:hypothetical protein
MIQVAVRRTATPLTVNSAIKYGEQPRKAEVKIPYSRTAKRGIANHQSFRNVSGNKTNKYKFGS